MRGLAKKSFLAVLVSALTLSVVALAAATTGSDERSPQPSGSVAPQSLAPTSGSSDDVPEIEAPVGATSEPVTNAPADSKDADTGESPTERTTAVNPAGHCVDLPDSSNIIEEPDKHPNWTVQPCEPDGGATDTQEPEDDHGSAPDGEQPEDNGGGPAEGRTPALNPDGVCIEMPNNSDIVQHPEKHAAWTVGGCSTSGNGE